MKEILVMTVFALLIFTGCSIQRTGDLQTISDVKTELNLNFQENTANVKQDNKTIADVSVLEIKPSTLADRLEKKKADDPQISSKELADYANELIPKHGINFWVDLADLIEKKTKAKQIKELTDGDVRFNFQLSLGDTTKKTFQIDSPSDSCCCGYAYADFPVSKITGRQMTVIVDEKPFIIKRIKDISFSQEYVLLDDKTKTKKFRSWQVPFETSPFGISEDGTKLYIEDESELLLEISENGNLKFVTKNSPQIISNGQDLRQIPKPKTGEILYKSGESGLMLFKSGNKTYIIDFPYVCT